MAKILLVSGTGNATFSAASTRYAPIGGHHESSATEAERQITIRTNGGTWSGLKAYVSANTGDGALTISSRINAGNGNQTVSIGAGLTGWFEDSSNSDTVAATDKINWKGINAGSAGSVTLRVITSVFKATTGTFARLASTYTGSGNFNKSGTSTYFRLHGRVLEAELTEANSQVIFRTTGTIQKLFVYVGSNGRLVTDTLKSRKNNADGNLAVSITSAATGIFEDTTNSDTIASGDVYNFKATGGADVNYMAYYIVSVEWVPTGREQILIGSLQTADGQTLTAATTYYPLIHGNSSSSVITTEANYQTKLQHNITFSKLQIFVVTNASSGAGTCDLRVNGASSALTVSITALTTGRFEDTTHSVDCVTSDLVNFRVAVGTGGDLAVSTLGVLASGPADTSIKTINGLAQASVKNVEELAIASVKNFNGLA